MSNRFNDMVNDHIDERLHDDVDRRELILDYSDTVDAGHEFWTWLIKSKESVNEVLNNMPSEIFRLKMFDALFIYWCENEGKESFQDWASEEIRQEFEARHLN